MNDCISRQFDTVDYEKCPYYEPDILYDEEQNEEYDAGYCKYKPTERKVIEDIKAEINEGIEKYKNKDNAVMFGLMCALYIINKHVEGWDK